jgi:hypothetical protein
VADARLLPDLRFQMARLPVSAAVVFESSAYRVLVHRDSGPPKSQVYSGPRYTPVGGVSRARTMNLCHGSRDLFALRPEDIHGPKSYDTLKCGAMDVTKL